MLRQVLHRSLFPNLNFFFLAVFFQIDLPFVSPWRPAGLPLHTWLLIPESFLKALILLGFGQSVSAQFLRACLKRFVTSFHVLILFPTLFVWLSAFFLNQQLLLREF